MVWHGEIDKVFADTRAQTHYVFGNHCVGTLTKAEFQAHTGAAAKSYYSFEEGGIHFIVLDGCFRSDGEPYQRKNFDWTDANIPEAELKWLQQDLAAVKLPVIVLAHQRLDNADKHSLRNAAEVRAALEQSGQVLAVFQGHSHQNAYQQIAGIHYCTLVAMVDVSGLENSGYAMLDIMPDHSLRLHGFRRQATRDLQRAG
jgi:alkaline phosphatase